MRRFGFRLNVLFGIWSVILLVAGAMVYRSVQQLAEDAALVAGSHQSLEANQGMLLSLVDAETGQRGYLVTGDRMYLEPYNAALGRVQGDLGRVAELARGDAGKEARIRVVQGLVQAKLQELGETIALFGKDPAAAKREVLSNNGKNLMDAIRGQVRALDRVEQAALEGREATRRHSHQVALRSGVVFAALGLAGVWALLLQVLRHARERERYEGELLLREERYRKLTELSPNAIWLNRDDRLELPNSEALRLMGASDPGQVAGRSVDEIWHPDSIGKMRARLRTARSGQVVRASEEALLRLDGEVRWVEVSSAPFEDSRGPAVQCVLTDITGRRRMEEELRTSEGNFRNLANAMPQLCWIADSEGAIFWYNQRWYDYTGSTPAEMEGWGWQSVHDPEALPTVLERWRASISTGVPFDMVFPLRGRDGVFRDFLTRVMPVRDEAGRVFRWFGTNTDISERVRAEAERRELEERMVQARKLEALGILVAGVAHNFNNILAVIMGTASMLEELVEDGVLLDSLKVIGTASERGRGLVKSMTHFARPSLALQVPIELNALVGELRELLDNTTRKQVGIVTVPADGPAWIDGDPGSLSPALLNLCLNGIDAMPNGGTLTLGVACPSPEWVEVSVEDTGEGMGPEVLAHAFEPFYTTKPIGKGTGLGLSISHGVVQAHGGTITISSAPVRGTRVELRFPRLAIAAVAEDLPPPPPAPVPSRILLVDDEFDIRVLMSRMLRKAGVRQVEAVPGGLEAVAALRSGPVPDLVILDQNMPGMDGIQTLAAIRALDPDLPVLVSSGQPEIQEWECFRQRNVGVISKPFTLNEILARLGRFPVG